MVDCVDYIIETNNDDFLEVIEAISRSHKEYANSDLQHILDIEAYSCTDFWKPDILYLESGELELIKKKYSTALKDDDCLNLTDCDFNFMVDPRTGRKLYESSSEELENNCINQSIGDLAHVKDFHVKGDLYKVEDKLDDQDGECDDKSKCNNATVESPFSPKGNKLVFVQIANSIRNSDKIKKTDNLEKYGKPPFSYSCLIAMALKNSESGYLPVSEIYNYIIEKFPYFKTAPDGWKNSIRHNLSLNKCFQKLETPLSNGTSRKACLWGLNETKVKRLNEEISKWIKTDHECADQTELDETSSDDFGRGLLEFEENDQQKLNSPLPLMLKDIKAENIEEIKTFQIEIAPIRETSSNESLLSDSEEQAWDDIEVDKFKSSTSYLYYVNDSSQPVFDSTLSFKTVRASA